jgi:beta-mannanase
MFPLEQNPRDHEMSLWRRAANGEFDYHHDAAAASLTPYTQQLIFRVGWEWNVQNTFAWRCIDVALAPDYIVYFRRIVAILRARLPTCKIDWCCAKGGATNASVDNWYPGAAWTDFVGQDKYDWWKAARNQAEWDQEYTATYRGGPKGIGTWLAYARSKGKRLSIPEWGLVTGSSAGGGDNAFWIGKMFDFFQSNSDDIAYECYFNQDTSFYKHRLQSHPNSGAMYRSKY